MLSRLLLVEDDKVLAQSLIRHLGRQHDVRQAATVHEASVASSDWRPDVVLLDVNLPDGSGLSLVERFYKDDGADVIVLTAFPKIEAVVSAMKAGAREYLVKPVDIDELDLSIERVLERRRIGTALEAATRVRGLPRGCERLLGQSTTIQRVREAVARVAATHDTTALIRGETGTGKELVAEAIHASSSRRGNPLIHVDSPSIPATMVEAELFGHERGAFTDAKASRRGLIELGDGGTVFLDEIGDLPLELQPKLLRVLEARSVRRIGSSRETAIDVRFVVATNRPLEAMARDGKFRSDLLYRLKVFEIALPALRERLEDVAGLARHFVAQVARRAGVPPRPLSSSATAALEHHDWPGNVRELRNVIERAVVSARGDEISAADLGLDLAAPPSAGSAPRTLADAIREHVLRVYEACGRNKTHTAQALGISRVTLREKLQEYDVD